MTVKKYDAKDVTLTFEGVEFKPIPRIAPEHSPVEHVERVLNRITVAHWNKISWRVDEYMGRITVWLGMRVLERDTGAEIPIRLDAQLPRGFDRIEQEHELIRWACGLVGRIFRHELAEQLLYDGVRVKDPHA